MAYGSVYISVVWYFEAEVRSSLRGAFLIFFLSNSVRKELNNVFRRVSFCSFADTVSWVAPSGQLPMIIDNVVNMIRLRSKHFHELDPVATKKQLHDRQWSTKQEELCSPFPPCSKS